MDTHLLIIFIICVFAILLFGRWIFRFREFKSQLAYFNQEIERASAEKVKYWKKKRRRLWRHFLLYPF